MMLLPWTLWHRVLNPPQADPIFRRSAAQPGPRVSRFMQGFFLLWTGLTLLLIIAIAPDAIFFVLAALAIALPVFFLISHSWIYGAYWSLNTASSIARERSANTHTLLHIAPGGADNADWLIALGCLHRGNTLRTLHRLVKIVVLTLLTALHVALILGLATLQGGASAGAEMGTLQVLGLLLPLIVACGILYIEHSHAIISALLMGILSGRRASSEVEARILALLLFLASQAALYSIWLLISRVSALLLALQSETLSVIAAPFLSLGIYLLLRALLIHGLWGMFRGRSAL